MTKITRTRRSADEWRKLIAEQTDSGSCQEVFCKQKRLALSTFSNWKRRLASEPVAEDKRNRSFQTVID